MFNFHTSTNQVAAKQKMLMKEYLKEYYTLDVLFFLGHDDAINPMDQTPPLPSTATTRICECTVIKK